MMKSFTLRLLIVIIGIFLVGIFFVGCATTETPKPVEYQKQQVGKVCSICGSPATFWCPVRKAWFCDKHAGRTYTPDGGYRYRCP